MPVEVQKLCASDNASVSPSGALLHFRATRKQPRPLPEFISVPSAQCYYQSIRQQDQYDEPSEMNASNSVAAIKPAVLAAAVSSFNSARRSKSSTYKLNYLHQCLLGLAKNDQRTTNCEEHTERQLYSNFIDKAIQASSEMGVVSDIKQHFERLPEESAQDLHRSAGDFLYTVHHRYRDLETRRGSSDLHATARDFAIAELAASLLKSIAERLFDNPDTRLAVYGTLRPGEENYHLIEQLGGSWRSGIVTGHIEPYTRYKRFVVGAPEPVAIPVEILTCVGLPAGFKDLDEFEGPAYERLLYPVIDAGEPVICNIYARDASLEGANVYPTESL